MATAKITPTTEHIHLGRHPKDFYLPKEKRNPEELFLLVHKKFFAKNIIQGNMPTFYVETNLALAKRITDVDFRYASGDREQRQIISVIPYQVLRKLADTNPPDGSKVPSIFAVAFGAEPFGGILSKKLFCLAFSKQNNKDKLKTPLYVTKWVMAPSTKVVILLAKAMQWKFGTLVGVTTGDLIESIICQTEIMLDGGKESKLKDVAYDFRELDGDKAMYHSFSRRYPDLEPKDVADLINKKGRELAQKIGERGVEVKFEQDEKEAYNELLQGVILARQEELKNCL